MSTRFWRGRWGRRLQAVTATSSAAWITGALLMGGPAPDVAFAMFQRTRLHKASDAATHDLLSDPGRQNPEGGGVPPPV